MVRVGRLSLGCWNCRKAKKGCDGQQPTCGRCARLNQACHGCRMSRSDDSSSEEWPATPSTPVVSPRAATHPRFSIPQSRPDSLFDDDRPGITAFRRYFYYQGYSVFEDFEQHPLVSKLMEACSMILEGNQCCNESLITTALALYAEALAALQAAIQDPQRAKEDATLMGTALLCIFERLNCRSPEPSSQWRVHIGGLIHLVQIRGRDQIRTKLGRAVFRDVREMIINDGLERGIQVPGFLVLWTQAMGYDPSYVMRDHLAILKARLAALRYQYMTGECKDMELKRNARVLEKDMDEWADAGRYSFEADSAPESSGWITSEARKNHAPQDTGDPWPWMNMLICRIILVRIQDAILQRSTKGASAAAQHSKWSYSVLRRQTIALVCMSAANLECSTPSQPRQGPVTGALGLVRLLHVAATCLMEEMGTAEITPRGETAVTIDEQSWGRPGNSLMQDYGYVLQRLTYIANSYGDRYAAEIIPKVERRAIRYNITRA